MDITNMKSLKAKVRKLKRELSSIKIIAGVLGFGMCVSLIVSMYLFSVTVNNEGTITQLNTIVKDIQEDYLEYVCVYKDRDMYIKDLENTLNEINSQLTEVKAINESYVDELNELRSRDELYDKYHYAIEDELGDRTQLTYAEIKLGEQLMLEKGYDPHLMFGSIMVESGGNPDAINSSSGATGYGQFMNTTAEFVWTDLMGNDTYSPEVMKNGESNIRMMAEYYDYLYEQKGNTFDVIKQYSGNITDAGASEYLARINNFTSKAGVIIE